MTSRRRRAAFRAAAIAASACIGAVATLALASPASAHSVAVRGDVYCDVDTGEWVITWTVENSQTNLVADITAVDAVPEADLSVITVGASVPKKGEGVLTDEQRISGDLHDASLTVSARWSNGVTDTATGSISVDGGCDEAELPIESTSDCDSLTIAATNIEGDPKDIPALLVTITVGDETVELTVPAGETREATFDANEGTVATVETGILKGTVTWDGPDDCDEPEAGGGGGDLPETGVPSGLLAAAALLLLLGGAGMYMVTRHRRIRFTA